MKFITKQNQKKKKIIIILKIKWNSNNSVKINNKLVDKIIKKK